MMRNQPWWYQYHSFPSDETGDYPHPVEVLRYYRELRALSSSQIADVLDVDARTVRNIFLHGNNTDSVTFRIKICTLLDIPRQLLRLDAKTRQPDWWLEEYPSLPAEENGYPDSREVVKLFRKRRGWTQTQLGRAFNPPVSQIFVSQMENEGKGLDSMKRRTALQIVLMIPPALLMQHDPEQIPGTQNLPSDKQSISMKLPEYKSEQDRFFKDYYTSHGYNSIPKVEQWVQQLEQLLPKVRNTQERTDMLSLITGYYLFLSLAGREERAYGLVRKYCNANIALATQALRGDQSPQSIERLALAYFYRAEAYREGNNLPAAQKDINDARSLSKTFHPNTQARLLMESGVIASLNGQPSTGLRFLDNANALIPSVNEDENPDYSKFNGSFVTLRRAMALTPGSRELTQLLPQAINQADTPRRKLILWTLDAANEEARGNYEAATTIALSAADAAKVQRSRLNRARLVNLYNKLATKDGNNPEVARLKLSLSSWK